MSLKSRKKISEFGGRFIHDGAVRRRTKHGRV
jgi:hypothetical protein